MPAQIWNSGARAMIGVTCRITAIGRKLSSTIRPEAAASAATPARPLAITNARQRRRQGAPGRDEQQRRVLRPAATAISDGVGRK